MEKNKKIFKWSISFALIVAILLAVILPLTISNKEDINLKNLVAEERAAGSEASDSGASTADKSLKGGAIYIEPYATYTMNGGTISGSSNTYGGAIFISTGATFTMTGGTISGCLAKYGGGIYVSTGATLTITAGTITKCSAEQGPAIYIEDGAIVNIDPSANISENEIYQYVNWQPPEVGPEMPLGSIDSGIKLKTMKFGTFPQAYVGSSMNSILEDWYTDNSPQSVKTYKVGGKLTFQYLSGNISEAYVYTDGNTYVRGQVSEYATSEFKNGDKIERGAIAWFKVEPINWYILNYDNWVKGDEALELFSEISLSDNIYYPDGVCTEPSLVWRFSDIRDWLNDEFLKKAFTNSEIEVILESEIVDVDVDDDLTEDKIYIKSQEEIQNGIFSLKEARIAGVSDFALALGSGSYESYWTNNEKGSTVYGKAYCFWAYGFSIIQENGNIDFGPDYFWHTGVRPALRLNLEL